MNDPAVSVARKSLTERALDHAHKDFPRVLIGQTAHEAVAAVKQSKLESRIVYFYAVDEQNRLQGVVPTRRLLLAPDATPISEIVHRHIVTLPADATLQDAGEKFMSHRLLAIPITDRDGTVLGVIDVDQYTDELRQVDAQIQSDDIFQLIGVRLAQVRNASLATMFRSRFPWLLCNAIGGIACAFIAGRFEHVLDHVVAIALFIPVVLALAESVSIQSVTLAFQLQGSRPAGWRAIWSDLGREARLGLMLGLACGGLVGGVAWIWQQHGTVAACILLSISLCVMLAATIGLTIPTLLHQSGRDLKVAAGPIALALTDMATITIYLSLAVWLL